MSNCKVIALTNQKGGVGKTTTTVNLGVSLAQQGNAVPVAEEVQEETKTETSSQTDQEMLLKVLSNPEMVALLKSLEKTYNHKRAIQMRTDFVFALNILIEYLFNICYIYTKIVKDVFDE